jgi:hypothetical protein
LAKNKASNLASGIDLAQLFGAVARNLSENRDTLNKADKYNSDHGDNMVKIFQSVANLIQSKSNVNHASQLSAASKELRKDKSGSAKLYAEGLERASKTFKGKVINQDNATELIQALMGSTLPASSTKTPGDTEGNLMESLLDSLGAVQPGGQQEDQSGLDIGDLLNAGMAFMDSKQKGGSNTEAIINAVLSSSPLGQSSHRTQSGSLVAGTIMKVLGSMTQK